VQDESAKDKLGGIVPTLRRGSSSWNGQKAGDYVTRGSSTSTNKFETQAISLHLLGRFFRFDVLRLLGFFLTPNRFFNHLYASSAASAMNFCVKGFSSDHGSESSA
jgi:hypothetical protein